MNIYLNAKVSAIADAVIAITSSMLEGVALEQRVMLVRHTHNSQPLLEFRVINPEDTGTRARFGVRQAWVYTYPKEKQIEIHYTTGVEIEKLVREYPSMQNIPSIAFSTSKRVVKPYPLASIYALCEILMVFLTVGPDESSEEPLPGVEDHLTPRTDL